MSERLFSSEEIAEMEKRSVARTFEAIASGDRERRSRARASRRPAHVQRISCDARSPPQLGCRDVELYHPALGRRGVGIIKRPYRGHNGRKLHADILTPSALADGGESDDEVAVRLGRNRRGAGAAAVRCAGIDRSGGVDAGVASDTAGEKDASAGRPGVAGKFGAARQMPIEGLRGLIANLTGSNQRPSGRDGEGIGFRTGDMRETYRARRHI